MRWWIAIFLAALGCDDAAKGTGIGHPDAPSVSAPVLLPITITEAFVATEAASTFVELALSERSCSTDADCGGATCTSGMCSSVDLSVLSVCAGESCSVLSGTLTTGRLSFSLEGLTLNISADALYLVDAAGDSHAVLAWGADPATLASVDWAEAIVRGAAVAGDFVAVGFPMAAGVAVAREAGLSGCALPSRDNNASIDASLCPTTTGILELTELLPQLEAGADSWLEMLNTGASTLALGGVRLCQPPWCSVFPTGTTLAAGARLVLHAGVPGLAIDAAHLRDDTAAPVAAVGEAAILAPGAVDIDDPTRLLSYVRYGSAAVVLADAAASAGAWDDANASASAPTTSGEVLVLLGPPAAAGSWQVWSVASPGE